MRYIPVYQADGSLQGQPKPEHARQDVLGRRAARKDCVCEQPQREHARKDADTPQVGEGGVGQQRPPHTQPCFRPEVQAGFKRRPSSIQ